LQNTMRTSKKKMDILIGVIDGFNYITLIVSYFIF
jgi:hypothetical protein